MIKIAPLLLLLLLSQITNADKHIQKLTQKDGLITVDYQQQAILTVLSELFPKKEIINHSSNIEQITINLFVNNRSKRDILSTMAHQLDIKFFTTKQKIIIYDN